MENEQDIDSNNNMAEKVINRIDVILKESNTLEEFSIIPSTTNSSDRNVSPVQYVASEHCLGLESWCVAHIFKYSQQQSFKLRKIVLRKPIAENVSKLNMYLNVALLIQPEVKTFWNIKRELNVHLDHCKEMQFSKLVLSHKPKSLSTYTYRTWLIDKFQVDCDHPAAFQQELTLIDKAVNCPNNYHAWNHRIWCMEYLLPKIVHLNSHVIIDELKFSVEFISAHVSEHSGFHYRQYVLRQFKQRYFYRIDELIQLTQFFTVSDCYRVINSLVHEQHFSQLDPKLIAICNQYVSLLLHELLEVCKQLNVHFRGHEAVWYHRRFIIYEIIHLLRKIYGIVDVKAIPIEPIELRANCNITDSHVIDEPMNYFNNQSNEEATKVMKQSTFYKNLIVYERDFLAMLGSINVQNDWTEKRLIKKHEKWLRCILNVDLNDDIVVSNGEILFKV